MRLIDADKLLEMMRAEYKDTKEMILRGEDHLDSLAEGYDECKFLIDKLIQASSYNAEERKHGEWIRNPLSDWMNCSLCGESVLLDNYDFCPSCGADMRSDSNASS